MTHATGTRLLAAIFFLLSGTVILAPLTVPVGIALWRKARKKEKHREQELAELRELNDRVRQEQQRRP